MAVFVDLVSLNEQLDSLFKFLSTIFTAESGIPFDALQALLDAKKDAEFIELLTKQVDIIFHVNEKGIFVCKNHQQGIIIVIINFKSPSHFLWSFVVFFENFKMKSFTRKWQN